MLFLFKAKQTFNSFPARKTPLSLAKVIKEQRFTGDPAFKN